MTSSLVFSRQVVRWYSSISAGSTLDYVLRGNREIIKWLKMYGHAPHIDGDAVRERTRPYPAKLWNQTPSEDCERLAEVAI